MVVLAASPRGWAGQLRAYAADHGGVVIRATVLTPQDAVAEHCAVVVVDDITSFLTPAFVLELHQQGRAVLGIYDPADAQGKGDLVDAGVDTLMPTEADTTELVAAIRGLAQQLPEDRASRVGPSVPTSADDGGRIIGVAGPPGGVGVSEVAIEMAAGLAAGRVSTVLVDADELAPSLSQRLAAPVHPNLHSALHAIQRNRRLDAVLHQLSTRRPLHLLPGMATAEDWHTVRGGSLAPLIGVLGRDHQAVIVDLGHALPRVDGPTGMRFGHGLGLVSGCHDLVVIASPQPTSIRRTVELIARVQPARTRLHVVLNQVGVDRFVRDESIAELRLACDVEQVHTIGVDRGVPRAGWQGGRVGRGSFRRDVAALTRALAVVTS